MSIKVILTDLVDTTFITKTLNMVTTINNLDMVYSQHLSTFINIALMIHLHNIQK